MCPHVILNNEYSLLKNEHLPRYLLLMAIAFAAFAHSRKKGEDQKLELCQEGMQHTKVCHVPSLTKGGMSMRKHLFSLNL